MKLENLLESKEFNISVGRMIERMQQAAEHNWDWLSFNGDSIDYDIDGDVRGFNRISTRVGEP